MKNQIKYYLIGIILIVLSAPLGYKTLNIIYWNKNLTGEFEILLNGLIRGYLISGLLIFALGILNTFTESKKSLK